MVRPVIVHASRGWNVGNLGHDALRGPGRDNWNLSLFKSFVLSRVAAAVLSCVRKALTPGTIRNLKVMSRMAASVLLWDLATSASSRTPMIRESSNLA